LVLSLILAIALVLVASGCKPESELVPVESITISAANNATTITTIGGTLQFTAVVLPADANDKSVIWSVTDGTGEASISSNGLLTAEANGTVTVKATSNDVSTVSATKIITITNQDIVASSITVSSDFAFIDVYHGTLQLSALVLPADAVNKTVVWSVENGTGSATISTSGLLTGVSNGTVVVKAASAQNALIYGTKTITLTNQDASVTSIEISSAGDVVVINAFQGTLQFSVVVLPAVAPNKAVLWSVVNGTGSATISSTGLLTAVSNGTVTVHATSVSHPAIADSMVITISNQEVDVTSIVLTSAGNVVVIDTFGGTLLFSANVLPANASDKAVTWSVTNGSGQATISASGLLTAVANGTVTVVVTSVSNSAINSSMVITISHQEIVVVSVAVSGQGDAVIIDELDGTLQMSALVLPENAADKSVVWSVENGTGTASINASGLLTAITDGTVIVKATSVSNNSIFGTKEITISNQVLVPEILAVDLKSADSFTILAKTGVSTASLSVVTGNIGVSPSPASYITGFSLIMDASNEYSTSSQVVGMIYAANYTLPTPTMLTAAISDMETAYTDAAGRAPSFTELYAGDLSGQTLTTGVYKFGTDVLINTNVTLSGTSTDVIIFQIAGSITQAASVQVILTGGILAENIFWQVAGDVAIGANAHFEGTILCMTSIALNTGASYNGKLFSQTAVTLDGNDIN
jgi:uncharacterized protein YjdB